MSSRSCSPWWVGCRNPEIPTQEAWDLAYETIYKALPPCRDCLCL